MNLIKAKDICAFSVNAPELIRIGNICLRSQCIAPPVHVGDMIVNKLYAALGHAKESLLLSTARQGSCFPPAALILPRLMEASGVACAQTVADELSPTDHSYGHFHFEGTQTACSKNAIEHRPLVVSFCHVYTRS